MSIMFLGYCIAGLFGAIWGSFANLCIVRLPPGEQYGSLCSPGSKLYTRITTFIGEQYGSLYSPGSHCLQCKHRLAWYDNIPLVSFILLWGKCRYCKAPVSLRYFLVEAVTTSLWLMLYHLLFVVSNFDSVAMRILQMAVLGLFATTLVIITWIDLKYKLILNKITYPAILLLYLAGFSFSTIGWRNRLIGIVVGYGVVRIISDLYFLLRKREGLGYGDGKLLAMVGALLGWQAPLYALFLGSVVGSVIGIIGLCLRRMRTEIPFGPFLSVGTILYLYFFSNI